MNRNEKLNTVIAFGLKLMGQAAHVIYPDIGRLPPPDLCGQAANDWLRTRLATGQPPLMTTKLGTYELKAFVNLYGRQIGLRPVDITHILHYRYRLYRSIHTSLWRLSHNAGFFPPDRLLADRWAQLFAHDWLSADAMASYQKAEAYLYTIPHPVALTRLDLEGYYSPFFWSLPWTSALRDRKVLVVHPFAETIERQYQRRAELFADPDVLPPFKSLTIVRSAQTIGGHSSDYADWFAALDSMKARMDAADYDIALIGCGAHGFHLAAHAKRSGKTAIHLGGALQLLFGIKGRRWDDIPRYRALYNEAWTRPAADEAPRVADEIENGCYW